MSVFCGPRGDSTGTGVGITAMAGAGAGPNTNGSQLINFAGADATDRSEEGILIPKSYRINVQACS